MARIIYNDGVNINTQNLSLSIDSLSGIINSTYSGSMSSFAGIVSSYSTPNTLNYLNNYVLINASTTITLPAGPINGTTYVFRSTTTANPTLTGGTYAIRNVGSASGTYSIQLVANGTYMFTYYNDVWYGI